LNAISVWSEKVVRNSDFFICFELLEITVGQNFPTATISDKSKDTSKLLFSRQLADVSFIGTLIAAVSETPGSHIESK
jgi:hypothetical protein